MGQIRSIVAKKKKKETGISGSFFFHILHEVGLYIPKQEQVVVIDIHEWKLKAKLA